MPHMETTGISNWTPEDLPGLSNKLCIISVGNWWTGFEAARILARRSPLTCLCAKFFNTERMFYAIWQAEGFCVDTLANASGQFSLIF